ncbi:MAG: ABC transporter permease [Actinomycetota bacterium]|nr:ABC transporter permease [Actinomycetota bacterium]
MSDVSSQAELATNPGLRPVVGPGAVGGGWKRFFDLLILMSVSDFRKAYFGTVLGYAWSLLRPLMLFAVLLAVFTQIFRIGSQGVEHYEVYLLLNIVLFSFFQEATVTATTAVVAQEGIVRKTQFPRLVVPMSIVLTSFFNLGMNMIAVLIFAVALGVSPIWTWLLFPLSVLALVVLTSAVSSYLSALYVRHRDVAIIWSVSATALFYGSAVLYPVSIIPEGVLRDVIFANPIVPILVQTNKWVIDSGAPGAAEAAGGWAKLIPAITIFVVACVVAVWYFRREAPRVAEEL